MASVDRNGTRHTAETTCKRHFNSSPRLDLHSLTCKRHFNSSPRLGFEEPGMRVRVMVRVRAPGLVLGSLG